jgi:hypothetical protein
MSLALDYVWKINTCKQTQNYVSIGGYMYVHTYVRVDCAQSLKDLRLIPTTKSTCSRELERA